MEYQITSKRLGAGAFAEVRMALCKRTREQLAVKIMDKNRLHMSQMNGTDFAREVEILKKPNIVRVHDVIETERYIYIFLQMVTGGDLFDYVKSCGKIPEEEAKYLFFQVLQAIEYLHDHDISHRGKIPPRARHCDIEMCVRLDVNLVRPIIRIQPENILRVTAQPNTRVMITDFGMAKTQTSPMRTMCGTLTYVAPEVLEGQDGYDKSIDCWSLGVILYVMLSGGHPFTTGEEDEVTISQRIRDGRVEFPSQWFEGVSHDAKRLIRSLLVVDPMHRLNSTDAINHPWFNDDCKIIDQYKLNIMIPWWVKEGKISGGDENAERLATRGEGGAGGGKLKTERLRKKHARPEPYPSPSPRPNRHHVSPRVPRTPSRRMASRPLTPSSVQNSMPKVISHALGPTTPTPRRVYHALRLEPLDQHYTTPVEDDEDEENEVGLEDGVRTVPDVANRRARIG
ncbi:kinase-like domain-containing protein [Jimgerdemannia flammicorona]|uniref:Kinase-like domain-containing protein n=1 Tax=Jimgerdemannia flammicorona TaxID=994334 RepID=A0A433Q5T1_9FUNG|nr:kinase-like domain-containing protein [Jimgerdemannia flammicorona]